MSQAFLEPAGYFPSCELQTATTLAVNALFVAGVSGVGTHQVCWGSLIPCKLDLQGTELASVGGADSAKDNFTNRTKMVLSSLQTNFEAAAELGSVKKRRLSSGSQYAPGLEVGIFIAHWLHCFIVIQRCFSAAVKWLSPVAG